MKIALAQLLTVFAGLGFEKTESWSQELAAKKLLKLKGILTDAAKVKPKEVEDAAARKILVKMIEAAERKEDIEIESAATPEASEPAKKAAKPAKTEEPAKKDADAADESEDSEEASEEPAKKATKPAKKAEKPAAKKADKPAKAKSEAKLDKYGYKQGSRISKVAATLSKKPIGSAAIQEAAGLNSTSYTQLNQIVSDGHAVEVEVESKKCWKLK